VKLSPFSYVVLSLVGRSGATAPELAEMMHRGRLYWTAPRSQWYAEPKRLAAAGLLDAVEEPGRTGPRTRYAVTDEGRRAVAEWLPTPVGLPRMQHEAVVRVLAADLADDPASVRPALASLREELAAARESTAEAERVATELGERGERLLVQHRMAHRMLDALEAWVDDVEELLERREAAQRGLVSPSGSVPSRPT
jgi:DNA-binding PadR family transcriptional regulator